MAEYQQTDVAGSQYQRGRSLYFENPLGAEPSLLVREERVINLGSRQILEPAGEILKTVEDLSVVFPLRNPETGEELGSQLTFQDVYVALYSLYWHLATERDTAAAQPEDNSQLPEYTGP